MQHRSVFSLLIIGLIALASLATYLSIDSMRIRGRLFQQTKEIAHLDAEVQRLKGELQVSAVENRIGNRAYPSNEARPEFSSEEGRLESANSIPLAKGLKSVEGAQIRGSSEPEDTVESIYLAFNSGNIRTVSEMIAFPEGKRRELEAVMQSLPPELAQKWKSPEELVAFFLGGSFPEISGMQILSRSRSFSEGTNANEQSPDLAKLEVQVQYPDGRVRQNQFSFYNEKDSWKWLVPNELVDRVLVFSRLQVSRKKGNP